MADERITDSESASKESTAPRAIDEQSGIISRLKKRLLNAIGRAVHDFDMIQEGDRILVGVSGGKDSLCLLDLLLELSRRSPVKFSLVAVCVDQCLPGFPAESVEAHLASTGLDYRMLRQDTFSIVQRLTPPGKSYCPVCSRLRRGILYNAAVELGCTKIALGHHREDLIETLFLSACYSGALKSMPPKLISDDGRNTVIRPLAYCAEETLVAYAEARAFPIIPANLCNTLESHRRKRIKALIQELAKEHPAVPGNLLNALSQVVPSHLLDLTLRTTRGEEPIDAKEDESLTK
jgi:tRNA 2-thiocytidine biosynthesis protein TtcA